MKCCAHPDEGQRLAWASLPRPSLFGELPNWDHRGVVAVCRCPSGLVGRFFKGSSRVESVLLKGFLPGLLPFPRVWLVLTGPISVLPSLIDSGSFA